MKIGFKTTLEQRMDEWISRHGGMSKLEEDLDYLLKRYEKEQLYDIKSKIRTMKRARELKRATKNGTP